MISSFRFSAVRISNFNKFNLVDVITVHSWITDSMDMGLGELRELVMEGRPGVLQFMGSQRVGTRLSD